MRTGLYGVVGYKVQTYFYDRLQVGAWIITVKNSVLPARMWKGPKDQRTKVVSGLLKRRMDVGAFLIHGTRTTTYLLGRSKEGGLNEWKSNETPPTKYKSSNTKPHFHAPRRELKNL